MGEERLSNLALLCIERDVKIDIDKVIARFAKEQTDDDLNIGHLLRNVSCLHSLVFLMGAWFACSSTQIVAERIVSGLFVVLSLCPP